MQMDHTSGEYRSMRSFHAAWSPSPTRATRAMTDGPSRMACPFPRPAGPAGSCRSIGLPGHLLGHSAVQLAPRLQRGRTDLIVAAYSDPNTGVGYSLAPVVSRAVATYQRRGRAPPP